MAERHRKNSRKKRRTMIVLLIVAAVVLAAAITGIVILTGQAQRDKVLNEEIKEMAQKSPEPARSQTPSGDSAEPAVSQRPDIPIDFAALKEENEDIYAWIRVPGTDVDYPIVQHPDDNAFYLTHNVKKQESVEGSVYTELCNSRGFTDPNTVIYGHNMKNGAMFATLHEFEDRTFFDENREIIVYTPEKILTYRIFAAYEAGDEHIMNTYELDDPYEFTRYLDGIFGIRDMKANIDTSMDVTNEDRIITLSTCVKGQNEKRYLVQAVLVSDE